MKRPIAVFVGLLIAVVVLAVAWRGINYTREFWHGFQRGFVRATESNPTYHAAFREGFKRNFLRTCEHDSTNPRVIVYCTCADTETEKRFDDSGLMAIGTAAASSQQRAQLQEIIQS